MKEKIKYHYDPKDKIMFKSYYGLISIDIIASSWMQAFEKEIIPKETVGFILDYREAIFDMDVDEHAEIANFYKKNLEVFRNKKIAIITDKPKAVVIVTLVEALDDGYFSKPFSTLEAARAWVLADI
ncbi:MAG: hypothetical protein K9H49_07410 [Bacteroidales bacterium]|nr:hypothetical protein [Bacteroidales bacterium]MCF8390339.1 hypothetical protein [Bacteroidales bacterium]